LPPSVKAKVLSHLARPPLKAANVECTGLFIFIFIFI